MARSIYKRACLARGDSLVASNACSCSRCRPFSDSLRSSNRFELSMFLQQHFHNPPLLGRPFLVGAWPLVAPQQPTAGQWLDLSSSVAAGGTVPSLVVVTPSSTAAEPSESAVAAASYTAVRAFVPLAAAPSWLVIPEYIAARLFVLPSILTRRYVKI